MKVLFGEWAPRRLDGGTVGRAGLPSDPEDPHSWTVEATWESSTTSGLLIVRWSCPSCGSRFSVSVSRPGPPPWEPEETERAVENHVRRAKVHPRCSEVRTVREVMGS
jgi:hypothetical protein